MVNNLLILGLAPATRRSAPAFLICVKHDTIVPMPELSTYSRVETSNTNLVCPPFSKSLTTVSSRSASRPKTSLPDIVITAIRPSVCFDSIGIAIQHTPGMRVNFARYRAPMVAFGIP